MKSLIRKKKKPPAATWSKQDDKLLLAIETGDLNKLKKALKNGGVPSRTNPNGKTPIYAASVLGRSDLLQELLTADPEAVNVPDEQGRQCLHWTVKGGLLKPTEICLDFKADVLAPDALQMTPLHYAAAGGHLEIAQLLLEHKASTAVRDKDGCSPLLLASSHGHPEVCRALVECGASVNAVDSDGKNALMYACESGSQTCAELLLKRGVKKDVDDHTGLSASDYAHENGHYGLSKLLDEAPAVASWEITEDSQKNGKKHEEVSEADLVSKFDSDQGWHDLSPVEQYKQQFSKEQKGPFSITKVAMKASGDQLKELEEENECVNQELADLRKEYTSMQAKLRKFEEEGRLDSTRPISPGEITKPSDVHQLEECQKEISLLKKKLTRADEDKKSLEDQIETLKVQVESFMPTDDGLDTDEEMNFEEGELEFSLPGVDGPNRSPVTRIAATLPVESAKQEQQLRGQIATLRIENEKLKEGSLKPGSRNKDIEKLRFENEDLKDRIRELGGDVPTVPMDVYNQLKEAQEDEIAALKRSLAHAQAENDRMGADRKAELEVVTRNGEQRERIKELEAEVAYLTSKKRDEEEEHLKIVSSYRSHLIAAAQGNMAVEVQRALFQIMNMRSGGDLNDVLSGDIV